MVRDFFLYLHLCHALIQETESRKACEYQSQDYALDQCHCNQRFRDRYLLETNLIVFTSLTDMKTIIHTDNAPAPIGPYSQGVKANGFLFLSGQIAINPENNEVNLSSIAEETHQVMRNINALLLEAEYGFEHVVKTTIFLSDMSLFAEVNEIYGSYFESHYPARETVAVKGLPKGVNVEISITAYKA